MRAVPHASDPLLRRMTIDEWAKLPEDEEGELVDGWLVEEEAPDFVHEVIVAWLLEHLAPWARRHGGIAGGSDAKLALSPSRGRKPDVTVFLGDRMPPARGLVRVPPHVAVEIVSSQARDRRRDRVDKRAEYAAFGVPFYWLVDAEPLRVEIHQLVDDGHVVAATFTDGVQRDVPGGPGRVLDVEQLRADIARLPRDESDDRGE
jgi:Uma2 family endonuclease